jgi:dTDP-4-dehydrorhamnose reductase
MREAFPKADSMKAIQVVPIQSSDFPTRAVRPLNSRLTRAASSFGLCMPSWQHALARELDEFVQSEQACSASIATVKAVRPAF